MGANSGGRKAAATAKGGGSGDMQIQAWMVLFEKLYGKADSERSPIEMWVAATAHFTTMGEAIRRMHFADLMKAAAHAFCWMSSFVSRCRGVPNSLFAVDESFSAIVATKYPFACGHCRSRPCCCHPGLMDAQGNKAAKYSNLLVMRDQLHNAYDSYTVADWLSMFKDIYGQNVHMLTLESIGFHFLEEAGEELTALRALVQLEGAPDQKVQGVDKEFLAGLATSQGAVGLYGQYVGWKPKPDSRDAQAIRGRIVHAKVDLFIELADTFSWYCSIINKVMAIAENCKDDKCKFAQEPFGEWLRREYMPEGKLRCPTCEKCPCECVFYR